MKPMEERILIVDDDITFALMLRTWLSKRGFGVGTASSVAAARTALEAEGFSLVLSDMRLPDEDGIALLQWMAGAGVAAPVIVMTSYAEIQNAVRCMKLGARDYVAKPVNPDELLKKIREALDVPAAYLLGRFLVNVNEVCRLYHAISLSRRVVERQGKIKGVAFRQDADAVVCEYINLAGEVDAPSRYGALGGDLVAPHRAIFGAGSLVAVEIVSAPPVPFRCDCGRVVRAVDNKDFHVTPP